MKLDELTDKQLGQIRKCFQLFDPDSTGYISVKSFGDALRWLKLIPTEGQIRQFLEVIDAKNTGAVRFEVFAAAAAKIWIEDSKLQFETWQAFLQFDKTDTGSIPASVLKKILTVYGLEPIPEREADKLIKKYADSKTNMIEYSYLIKAWKK